MEKYSYHKENFNMLTQFVAAFDDAFVYRYDKSGVAKEKIAVRYVMGPKQRVLYDIVDQAKNIKLPVVSLEQKNLKRDPNRVQNKDQHMYRPHINDTSVSKIPQPVPVTMDIDVSFIANYKEDIDQIVSNFIPWCNPYFVISWKIPDSFGLDFDDELRSEVSWSGSIDYENPLDIDGSTKYRIVGNTSFTIKGWLFPALETPVAPIYVVNSNFHAVGTGADLYSYDSYPALSGVDYTTTDVILISAYPEFTNCFINGRPFDSVTMYTASEQTFTFYGKRFDFENKWYLSANQVISELDYEEIVTAKYPTISGYRIPDSYITTVNNNIAYINLSSGIVSLSGGNYTFVTANSAGWSSSCGFIIDTYNLVYNEILIYFNDQPLIYV